MLRKKLIQWLSKEFPYSGAPLCDFDRIQYEIRPCDVLLIEGRSRISEVIKVVTQSAWSHACLYIGRLYDIDDPKIRQLIMDQNLTDPNEQLVLEGLIGKGTVVTPLSQYRSEHIRICRPRGISRQDAQRVLGSAIQRIGSAYDMRQLFDLMRFLLPWRILPKRYRSTLFHRNAGEMTRAVCSTVIAAAFEKVRFPILPLIILNDKERVELVQASPRLFTPRDFDYSPFFEIIKYPLISVVEKGIYEKLPWNDNGLVTDGKSIIEPVENSQNLIELLSKLKHISTKIKKKKPSH